MLSDVIEVSAPEALGAERTRVYRGRRSGQPVAAVLSPVVTQGYSGPIQLIVAIRSDGTLAGVRVLSHRETPGLGDKIEDERSDWILGFAGKSLLKPPTLGLEGEARRRRIRPVHRRNHHAARHRSRGERPRWNTSAKQTRAVREPGSRRRSRSDG